MSEFLQAVRAGMEEREVNTDRTAVDRRSVGHVGKPKTRRNLAWTVPTPMDLNYLVKSV